MVSSTAIPRAIENVIAVDGLNFIPEKPIIAEYFQRCFDQETSDSISNLIDQD